jgi:hypothetical protein
MKSKQSRLDLWNDHTVSIFVGEGGLVVTRQSGVMFKTRSSTTSTEMGQ